VKVDVTVIGSGFAGSILAWILAASGRSVILLDRSKHPRFAIGESSTPIADTILKRLGQKYGLKPLEDLSCWGTWQQTNPELPCGRKRGFSYLAHRTGERFQETELGERSLLVAASPTDFRSDTHWHRSTLDQFLCSNAVQAGVIDRTGYEITEISQCELDVVHTGSAYKIRCAAVHGVVNDAVHGSATPTGEMDVGMESTHHDAAAEISHKGSIEDVFELKTTWIVDASGASGSLSKFFSVQDLTCQLKTRTHAWFAHFKGVKPWAEIVNASRRVDFETPFSADDAAQHHLLHDGWMWMLRFNQGVTSVGYTTTVDMPLVDLNVLKTRYPSLGDLFGAAECVAPTSGIVRTKRLQKWLAPVVSPRCVMLPTASLTLDSLHSTGIAHALAGVERLAPLILSSNDCVEEIARYGDVLRKEARFLDQLVQMAYRNLSRFDHFTVACMVYFAAAIRCEETYQSGLTPSHLWNACDDDFCDFVHWVDTVLDRADQVMFDEIRHRMERWNTAGLMDSGVSNRYAYTATK